MALKGIDAAVYSALSHLSIPVSVRPLYNATWNDSSRDTGAMYRNLKSFRQKKTDQLKLIYRENDGRVEHEEELESFEKRFEALKCRRTVIGWEVKPEQAASSGRELGLGRGFTELAHRGDFNEDSESLQVRTRTAQYHH